MNTFLKTLLDWFLSPTLIVWVFTNPLFFITAPLFAVWFNFLTFIPKVMTVPLSKAPYAVKSRLSDTDAVALYVASLKYHLNRWLKLFPQATYPRIAEYFAFSP